MNLTLLQKLWLSQDEANIYLFLIHHQNKTLAEISKWTQINRPKLYKILPSMLESGLIGSIINGKRILYIAENPKILSQYLETIKDEYDLYIPEIEKLYKNQFSKPIFKHLTGKNGIKNIFLDIGNTLKTGDVFYRYSSRNDVEKTSIPKKDYEQYKKLREEKRLERYVITNEYLHELKPKKLEKDVVVIPKKYDIFEDNITKIIYADRVAIIDYNTFECFIIESPIFANFERKIFMLLFKFLKK